MLTDILRANTASLMVIATLTVLLVAVHLIALRIPLPRQDRAELQDVRSAALKWFRFVYFLIVIGTIVGIGIQQSINYVPRNAEDRSSSEADQKRFEQRIEKNTRTTK